MFTRIRKLFCPGPLTRVPDAEYAPLRRELRMAGLSEKALRKMDPDERVAALEQAKLDPYDYIYLAWA